MSILQELHNLSEATVPGENLIELADLIKHFPNNHKKAIEKLWGGPRLSYHGVPFFDGDNDIYGLAAEAVKKWHEQGGSVELNLSDIVGLNTEGEEVSIEVNYDDNTINPEVDGQEVYMGYDVSSDTLYIGYDVHFNEEMFNQEWDDAFKEATGIEFDYDDPAHSKAFSAAHKEFIGLRPWVLFSLDWKDGSFEANDEYGSDGSFYPAGHKKTEELGLLDLRLD